MPTNAEIAAKWQLMRTNCGAGRDWCGAANARCNGARTGQAPVKLVIQPGLDGAFDMASGRYPILRQSAQILCNAWFSKMRDLLTLEFAKQMRL
jgi:hypothetical protein